MYAGSVTRGQDQGVIGVSYLDSIRDQADVSTERAVAGAAAQASRSVNTWRAQVALASTAMNAIAAGLGGSVGPAIAAASHDAMFSDTLQKGQDQGVIGQSALGSIAKETQSEPERILAETAHKAGSSVQKWRGQVAVADATLKAIENVLGDDIGDTLAEVGHKAVYSPHISTAYDQAVVGLRFTEAIAQHSDDSEQKVAAKAALKAASQVSTVHSQVAILGGFLGRQ